LDHTGLGISEIGVDVGLKRPDDSPFSFVTLSVTLSQNEVRLPFWEVSGVLTARPSQPQESFKSLCLDPRVGINGIPVKWFIPSLASLGGWMRKDGRAVTSRRLTGGLNGVCVEQYQ
jgi:hypothetical protein